MKLCYTLCARVTAAVDTDGSLLTEFSGFRLSENSVRGLTVRKTKIIASDPDGSAV